MIKHAHRLTGTEPLDFAIPPVDFCRMAKAAGADAYTIRHPNDFAQLDYQALCSRKGPTLLEVYIDPEDAPPLGMV
jgi:acetolactate synthase-1/2/3 large subunit